LGAAAFGRLVDMVLPGARAASNAREVAA